MATELKDYKKLCIHTITTKPWQFETSVEKFAAAGVAGITIWRDAVDGRDLKGVGDLVRSNNMSIVSYCRGGFFPHTEQNDRKAAIDDNLRMIDEAAAIGAPLIVLVCGSSPAQPLAQSREQIRDGIEALIPRCVDMGIKLAIEPLHPMYADNRSAINTLRQANEMAEYFQSDTVGVAVDIYHLWWDPDLEQEIYRCGKNNNLYAFHICDWKTPTTDFLLDRGLMGEGCIPVRQIRDWVGKAGFNGFNEVEIFSNHYWGMNQGIFLDKILDSYLKHS
jgi:sugar phosphate isomerase/epimerase